MAGEHSLLLSILRHEPKGQQTTFSKTFSWKKMFVLWLKFHCNGTRPLITYDHSSAAVQASFDYWGMKDFFSKNFKTENTTKLH